MRTGRWVVAVVAVGLVAVWIASSIASDEERATTSAELEPRPDWDPSLRRGVRNCSASEVEAAIVDDGAYFDGGTFELFGGGSALEDAVACGPEMAALLARIEAYNDGGDTPLHAAVFLERPDLVAAVLDAGADVDGQDASGDTALLDAASAGSVPMVELLLSRGADPDLANDQGHNPLVRAVAFGYADVVRPLLAAGASPEVEVTVSTLEAWLTVALPDEGRSMEDTMDLIDEAFGVEPHPDQVVVVLGPARPLFIAAARGDAAVVQLLLDAGADPTVPGGTAGNRPVDAARIMGHDDVVALLGG